MKTRALCLLLLFSVLLASQASATSINDTTVNDSTEVDTVKSIAVDYVTNFVNNAYKYERNDLYDGTIYELLQNEGSARVSTNCYSVADETVSVADLSNRIETFKLVSDYFRYIRTKQEIKRYNFNYTPNVIAVSVNDESATVHIYTEISFKYELDGETALCGDNYYVYLHRINGEWLVVDVQSEEFESYGLNDMIVTYSARIAAFDEWLEVDSDRTMETEESTQLQSASPYSTISSSDYDRTYNVNNAIAYAYTYTTSAYNNYSSGNSTTYMNSNFNDYSSLGGNCQNFVSQCVWAGFAGNDKVDDVNNHAFPMNSSWYETKSTWEHSASWTGVNDFYSYISSSSSTMLTTSGSASGSFAYIPLNYLRGAVLHVNPNGNGGYKHAVIITKATGRGFSEIEICGNSPMRKAVKLSDQGYDDTVRYILPTAMKSGRTCSGNAHSFSGSHCKCSNCGYNKLKVTGTMIKPIAVGTTQTITASANSSCYRMAICISYGSNEQWTEYTNTSQINKSFTFSNTGLYTITVVARDVAPSDSNSVTATHVFKIRVY